MFLSMAGSTRLDWLHGRTTELRVTGSELVVTGNLRKFFSTSATMPASEVRWLGFNYLGPNIDGLRVEGGETDIYVPGLNRKQAESVADTILRRFPNIRPDFPR
jgi:hypothetical protein